jgi:hypothetical protein
MSNRWFSSSLVLACQVFVLLPAYAQHSDVEFYYEEGRIVIESGSEGLVFEGNFDTSGTDRQFASEPGFASELAEGLGINAGDEIVYHVLDHLFYWDGASFQPPAAATQLRIFNRPPSVPDTTVTGSSGPQPGSFLPAINRIGAADESGDFHSDLRWALEPNVSPEPFPPPAPGAYGVKLALGTDAEGVAASDPFFMVFNFGLDEAVFENAVGAFAGLLVAEPGSSGLLVVGAVLLFGAFFSLDSHKRLGG